MTTRKRSGRPVRPWTLAAALAATVLGGAGCATPGPLHIYASSPANAAAVTDFTPDTTASVPSFAGAGETLTGLAYDPFTDHFFLRLSPGNLIRVVDRPARAVKREFVVPELAAGGGDLAVRPRDGHLFAVQPGQPALLEFTRFGKFVRSIPLAGLDATPLGLACDPDRGLFFTLRVKDQATRLATHDSTGRLVSDVPLAAPVSPRSLGCDAEKREFYVPLASEREIGVFDERGNLRRTLPQPAAWVDVGPRSFLRLF